MDENSLNITADRGVSEKLRLHTACFSGHRLNKLNLSGATGGVINSLLYQETEEAVKQGYYRFYTGMAEGVDLWAAEAVIALRKKYPKLELHCVYPFPAFLKNSKGEMRYQQMLIQNAANSIQFISPHYTKDCFRRRNQYMIDRSSLLVALVIDRRSGTGQTIRMAERAGIRQVVIDLNHPAYSAIHKLWGDT